MGEFTHYLESATVHGLSYIASTKRFVRLFWICVVLFGFSTAFYLIYDSFYFWKQSPISTTIETLPISQITLPNITVCPMKNSVLNLNHDIMKAGVVKLEEKTRNNLSQHAIEVIQDTFFDEIMRNLRGDFKKKNVHIS